VSSWHQIQRGQSDCRRRRARISRGGWDAWRTLHTRKCREQHRSKRSTAWGHCQFNGEYPDFL